MTDPAAAVAELRTLLEVEEIDTDLYRGAAAAEGPGRVFGGQVVAQALAAAARGIRDAEGKSATPTRFTPTSCARETPPGRSSTACCGTLMAAASPTAGSSPCRAANRS
ncbi:hypothetical protein ACFSHP_14745 [Novosphingobium panipatense]